MNPLDGRRATRIALLLLAVPLIFFRLGSNGLHDGDEAHYAQVAKEAAREGHWLTLTFAGKPWFEKPPLLLWAEALLFRAAGVSETTVRLPSAAFGLGAILATEAIGAQLATPAAAFGGAAFLATSVLFLYEHGARSGEFDSATTLITIAMLLFARRFARGVSSILPLFALAGLAFMIKNVFALVPLAIALACLLLARDTRRPRIPGLAAGAGVFTAIALPWHVYAWLRHGRAFLDVYLGEHILGRATANFFHQQAMEFYFAPLLRASYPWFPIVVAAWSAGALRAARTRSFDDMLLALWPAGFVAVFSLASTRFPWYIYPALPALGILGAAFLIDGLRAARPSALFRVALLANGIFLLVTRTNAERFHPFFEYAQNSQCIRQIRFMPFGPARGLDAAGVVTGLLFITAFLAGTRVRPRQEHTDPSGGRHALAQRLAAVAFAAAALVTLLHAVYPLRLATEQGPTKTLLVESRARGRLDLENPSLYKASWYIAYFYADELFGLRGNPELESELLRRQTLFKQIHGGRREPGLAGPGREPSG